MARINVLTVGGGGREHALAWKIRSSPLVAESWCAPGNPGIASVARLVSLDLSPPFGAVVDFCRANAIGLVVVGPEDPLAAGMADALVAAGIETFGPKAAGARIEASKEFAKEVMNAAGVPTAAARSFGEVAPALAFVAEIGAPCVVKADGLAAGKGVTVARTREEAEAAVRDCLERGAFGASGARVLIEEFMEGVEVSLLAFVDGKTVRAMDSAQDHKQVHDGDRGPNTGGMGAISPAPALTPALRERAIREILEPAARELARRGIDYRGVLYAGLMLTAQGPKVVEFNCRFGDPEVQTLLPRLENDLVEVMLACARGELDRVDLRWRPESCVCVVAASAGYPGPYAKGIPIEGLDDAAEAVPAPDGGLAGPIVFHAGTALDASGRVATSGGRVLGATALGAGPAEARAAAYARLSRIRFEGMHFRTDIGFRAG